MIKEKSLSLKQVWSVALKGISQDLPTALPNVFFFCFSLATLQFTLTYLPLFFAPKPIDENVLLTQRVMEGLWQLALSIVFSVIIPWAVYRNKGQYKNVTLFQFIGKHVKLVSIETLRTLPVILIYFVLLIIPGLVKMVRLVFVPLIVQIYRPYHEGKVDALQESTRLTKGAFAGIATYYFISQFAILGIVLGIPSFLQKFLGYEGDSFQNLVIDFIFNVPIAVGIELAVAVGLLRIFEHLVILKGGRDELAF